MHRIESLLQRTIGLDVASLGASAVERTLRQRMKSLGFKEVASYLAYVNATPAEWEELLEAVVVTETWFFRDQVPFTAFVQLVQQVLTMSRTAPLRVLSLPCSTGEEPYSLAMALRDAGLARNRFTIEAVDISGRALTRAQRGLYGKNSFRGKALEFRDRHFTSTKDGFLLNQGVRDAVRFARGNLLAKEFLTDREPYDFVFCRNLLIYFDRATQRRALQQLHGLLTQSGVLFVGPAELPLVSENGFTPVGLPMAFACRKSEVRSQKSEVRLRTSDLRPAKANVKPTLEDRGQRSEVGLRTSDPGPQTSDLAEARGLADAGQLAEAAALCEAHLKAQGPSAEAYYLLGLTCDASGNPAAVDYYRKALYLEPDHYETLLQMALLLERNGDRAGAQTFKRRAQRLQQKL